MPKVDGTPSALDRTAAISAATESLIASLEVRLQRPGPWQLMGPACSSVRDTFGQDVLRRLTPLPGQLSSSFGNLPAFMTPKHTLSLFILCGLHITGQAAARWAYRRHPERCGRVHNALRVIRAVAKRLLR